MDDTLLVIAAQGIPPYSARGLTQTIDPIAIATQLERAVNGQLVDLSAPQMRKYASRITCKDHMTPAFGGLYPGMVVEVSCAAELVYPTANPGLQDRAAVADSTWVNGDYTVYRPQLTMVVVKNSISRDEWGAETSWTLELEEE